MAVPAYDPKAVVAVRSLGELLRGSLARQGKLLKELQALLPKLATCKAKISLASLPNRASGLQAAAEIISLASRNALSSHADKESLAGKVGEHFGVSQHELSSTAAASAEALAAFRKSCSLNASDSLLVVTACCEQLPQERQAPGLVCG